MSRTRKDRPYWVRLNDKKETIAKNEYHNHNIFGKTITLWTGEERTYADYCTIDEPAMNRSNREIRQRPCRISPGWNYYYGTPTSERVNLGYWSPLRRDETDKLRKLTKFYNAGEDLDEVDFFLNEKTRHATYGGGDWD